MTAQPTMEELTLEMAIGLVEADAQADESFLIEEMEANDAEFVEPTMGSIIKAKRMVLKQIRALSADLAAERERAAGMEAALEQAASVVDGLYKCVMDEFYCKTRHGLDSIRDAKHVADIARAALAARPKEGE